jgi:hypothetical protein
MPVGSGPPFKAPRNPWSSTVLSELSLTSSPEYWPMPSNECSSVTSE